MFLIVVGVYSIRGKFKLVNYVIWFVKKNDISIVLVFKDVDFFVFYFIFVKFGYFLNLNWVSFYGFNVVINVVSFFF